MEALKANDMAKYLQMLVGQGLSPEDPRYREIAAFVESTDRYLHRLATRLSQSRMQEQLREMGAAAMRDAKVRGGGVGVAVGVAVGINNSNPVMISISITPHPFIAAPRRDRRGHLI